MVFGYSRRHEVTRGRKLFQLSGGTTCCRPGNIFIKEWVETQRPYRSPTVEKVADTDWVRIQLHALLTAGSASLANTSDARSSGKPGMKRLAVERGMCAFSPLRRHTDRNS